MKHTYLRIIDLEKAKTTNKEGYLDQKMFMNKDQIVTAFARTIALIQDEITIAEKRDKKDSLPISFLKTIVNKYFPEFRIEDENFSEEGFIEIKQ